MANTVASVTTVFDGPVRIRYATVTMDNSYATGGEVLTAAQFGLQSLDAVFLAGNSNGVALGLDSTGVKITAFGTNTTTATQTSTVFLGLAQIPNAIDLSGQIIKVLVVGH